MASAPIPLGPARVLFTDREHGDLGSAVERGEGGPSAEMERRRHSVLDRPWTWLRQEHGSRVVVVDQPGGSAGAVADAAVTADPRGALAVLTADCAPVALASPEGVIGVAHAGWRGLVAGVVEAAAEHMRELGASALFAAIGPCIHAECYEFSAADLDRVAERLGPSVRRRTAEGRPALDVVAGVRRVLEDSDADLVHVEPRCTACDTGLFSHRARREEERQATVVWIP